MNQIRNLAYKLIFKSKLESIPINLFDISNQLSNLKVQSYAEVASENEISVDFVARNIALSNWASISKKSNKYLLLYNGDSTIQPLGRIRFSFAHELGHLFLGHLESKSAISLGRLSNNSVENKDLEQEADFFASELLVPLVSFTNFKTYTSEDISQRFDVSKEAAKISIQRFKKINWLFNNNNETYRYLKKIHFTERHDFSHYLPSYINNSTQYLFITHQHIFFSYCNQCHALTASIQRQKHFSVCNSKNIYIVIDNDYFKFHETEEQELINYKKYNLIENPSRPKEECPKCQSAITEKTNFCDVCGIYLINRCTGSSEEGFNQKRQTYTIYNDDPLNNNEYTISINNVTISSDFNQGCDCVQSGKARYCSQCGSITTYYLQGLLNDWKKEKNDIEENLQFSHIFD